MPCLIKHNSVRDLKRAVLILVRVILVVLLRVTIKEGMMTLAQNRTSKLLITPKKAYGYWTALPAGAMVVGMLVHLEFTPAFRIRKYWIGSRKCFNQTVI